MCMLVKSIISYMLLHVCRWEHFWLVVQGVSILNNIAYIIPLLGPDVLRQALINSQAHAVPAVICASLTWSIGTIGFGTAIKLVGVGLGTALTMSFVVVFGVMWGLIFAEESPTPKALAVIISGVVLACAGFATLGFSVATHARTHTHTHTEERA